VQIAASIPNFLIQEQVSLGEGYLKSPFKVRDGYLDLPKGPGLASNSTTMHSRST
jgi:galactonate dehydratase